VDSSEPPEVLSLPMVIIKFIPSPRTVILLSLAVVRLTILLLLVAVEAAIVWELVVEEVALYLSRKLPLPQEHTRP